MTRRLAERIRTDFDAASIHRKDLALYSGLWGGEAVPAPARQLGGWKDEAVEQMALHLVELGLPYESAGTDGRLPVSCASTASARFIRLDPDAVAGPLFQPVSDEEGW